MLGRILFFISTYGMIAFGCGYVGAALGVAAARAFHGERPGSWLNVLVGLVASGLFLMVVFSIYYGTYDRPVIPQALQLVGLLMMIGVGLATVPVLAADAAAEALTAGALAAFLSLVMALFLVFLLGPRTAAPPTWPYLVGTFVPAGLGALAGWAFAWRLDLDELLDDPAGGGTVA